MEIFRIIICFVAILFSASCNEELKVPRNNTNFQLENHNPGSESFPNDSFYVDSDHLDPDTDSVYWENINIDTPYVATKGKSPFDNLDFAEKGSNFLFQKYQQVGAYLSKSIKLILWQS